MAHSDNSGLASSFTDLMTSLAVIFILLLCITNNEARQQSINMRNIILLKLKKELNVFTQRGLKIKQDPKDPLALLIIVPKGLLDFKVDQSEIPPKGKDFLALFIPKLANVVCDKKFRDDINSIVVEGHTDSTGTDQYNWELSQKRSMAVVDESLNILDSKNPHLRDDFVEFISASGRGRTDLIKNSNGTENRGLSRRVIFKIRVRSIEQRVITKVIPK